MKSFLINENDAGQRLDKFILKVTVGLPSSLLYKGIRKNSVKVNKKRVDGAYKLCVGDEVKLWFPDEFFGEREDAFLGLNKDPQVVYEDGEILIVNKPVGLSCHSDSAQKNSTLIDIIKGYLFRKGEYDPQKEASFAPALCNRIDRNTQGLVICAKTAVALRSVNEAIRQRLFKKEYYALIKGIPSEKRATLKHFLIKNSDTNRVSVFDSPRKGALTAILDYEIVKHSSQKQVSLARVVLHTGRTHQIRAQFAHVGHPLVGDGKYGVTVSKRELGFEHQALFSYKLTLFFPDGDPLAALNGKSFALPLPKEFEI